MAESSNGHFTEKTIEAFWVQVANHVRSWLLVVADMEPLPISGTGSWLPVLYRFSLKSMDDRNDTFYTCWDEDLMFTAVNFEVEPPE